MISTFVPIALAAAAVLLPALVTSMPEHAKRYRDNANQISQHHRAAARSGEATTAVDEPSHEVVIYEETYPYNPAEYLEPGTSAQDYYPQHYNHLYQVQPKETRVDRNDNRRVFLGGLGVSVLDPHALRATVSPSQRSQSRRRREAAAVAHPRIFTDIDSVNPAVLAGIVAFMIGVVFIGGVALKIYAVQQLFQAKLDFIENAIDAKQALITPNLERLIEAKLGIKVFVLEGILGLLNAQRDLTGGLGGEVANIEADLGQFAGVAQFLCELVEANSGIDCP